MKIWRPYTQMQTARDPLRVVKAEGAYLHLADGRKILDGISSWWVITHGHCTPEISEAIAAQARNLDQVVFADFEHDAAGELVEALGEFLPPVLNRIFFSDNGSTAVEVAMKMAYQAHRQSGKSSQNKFLAFEKAYHGDTCGAMSITADGVYTQAYSGLRFDVIRCKQAQYSSDPLEKWVGDFRLKIEANRGKIAAAIIEPLLQGAGGMILWPIAALKEIYRICKREGIFVIFDEVMTGFGRTGEMFAFEKTGCIPNFLCLSKGLTGGSLPLALTLTTDEVYQQFLSSSPEKMFFHGHSFTGNAISCAAARANLKIFQSQPVLEHVRKVEKGHLSAIAQIKRELPLKDARVIGDVGIIELDFVSEYGGTLSKKIAETCLENELFIRPLGNVIYLMPPYCISNEELSQAWKVISQVCSEVIGDFNGR